MTCLPTGIGATIGSWPPLSTVLINPAPPELCPSPAVPSCVTAPLHRRGTPSLHRHDDGLRLAPRRQAVGSRDRQRDDRLRLAPTQLAAGTTRLVPPINEPATPTPTNVGDYATRIRATRRDTMTETTNAADLLADAAARPGGRGDRIPRSAGAARDPRMTGPAAGPDRDGRWRYWVHCRRAHVPPPGRAERLKARRRA